MDEDEKRDDEEVSLSDGALDDALDEEVDDDEDANDEPLSLDEFGGGDDFDGKQWE